MDFKNVALILFLLPLLVNCSNGGKSYHKECLYTDSINIKNDYGNRDYCLSGNRLFPNPCLGDEESFKIAEKTNIFSILEKSDTLYVLSGKKIFSENLDSNQYFPIINDSTINIFYSRKYQIVKDPDPPKWTAIENEKDYIIVRLEKDNFPYWVNGTITDTIFQFKDGLKIGIDKSRFFQILGIDFTYNKDDFTVLLTSMFESNVSWYYRYYCSNYTDEIYCYPDGFHVRSYLKYFLMFKNNKLVEIKIHS